MSNEQTMYGIPVSELQKHAKQVNGGTYYDLNGYCLYVPNNVDENTAAFVYIPGAGGSGNDAAVIRDLINNQSPNQIIFIADESHKPDAQKYANFPLQVIENVGNQNGVTIKNIDVMGFSNGGAGSFQTSLAIANKFQGNGKHSAIFCDANSIRPSDADVQALKNDGTTIMFLKPRGTPGDNALKLAQGGVDVIYATTTGSHAEHVALNREALQNGIINFVSGESDELANRDIYKFLSYDHSTGKWVEIPFSAVVEKYEHMYIDPTDPKRYYNKLSGLKDLKCNNSYLGSKISAIRSKISSTNFLNATVSGNFSSTTNVPNAAYDIIQSYFTTCSELLNFLEKDTVNIINIGNSIDNVNVQLNNAAEELNNTSQVMGNEENITNNVYGQNTGQVTGNQYNGYVSSGNNYNSGSHVSGSIVSGAVTDTILGNTTTDTTEETTEEKKIYDKELFLKPEELHSDDNRIVYTNNQYKAVIYYEGEKVLGIDYYFEFDSADSAKDGMPLLKEALNGVDDCMCEDKFVKVMFKEEIYKDMTLTKVKSLFEKFEEVKKEDLSNESN